MKVGDLVQRTSAPGNSDIGMVIEPFFEGLVGPQVTVCWTHGSVTAPLEKNLEIVSERG
jgi:hypothetical protein